MLTVQFSGGTPQQRVEKWGFDSQPLKQLLVLNPLTDDNTTMQYRKTFKWPDRVSGEDNSIVARDFTLNRMLKYLNERITPPVFKGLTHHAQAATAQSELAEEAEIRLRGERVRKQQAELERAEAELEVIQDLADTASGNARPRPKANQVITVLKPEEGEQL